MAKKRRKKKGKKKVKKSGPKLPTPENTTYYEVEEECILIENMISDIQNHEVIENLNNESNYAIWEALTKATGMLELICVELERAEQEPVYRLGKDQIKNLREL